MTTGLVLIDLMPRIVALPVAPHTGPEVLDRCLQLASAFRAAGRPVFLVRVDRPNVAEQPPGSGFVEGLVHDGDTLIVKNTVGAFSGTTLEADLRARGVDTVVFGGLVTTMGVESTARAASDAGFEVEFVEDAMSGLTAEEHAMAVGTVFPRFGKVTKTADY
ncbi:isochorismatase family protein [Longispora urticae]